MSSSQALKIKPQEDVVCKPGGMADIGQGGSVLSAAACLSVVRVKETLLVNVRGNQSGHAAENGGTFKDTCHSFNAHRHPVNLD